MILQLFRRTPRSTTIASLYGMIVAQSRSPIFYAAYGVPDTVNGRFEMITLHTVLVLQRVEEESGAPRRLGQALFDMFCQDMDANMREMGVGDLAVPKKMRRIGEAFYGRQAAYRTALANSDDGPLRAVLERDVFAGAGGSLGAARLATYMRAAAALLAETKGVALLQAQLRFPDPEQVMPAVGAKQVGTEK